MRNIVFHPKFHNTASWTDMRFHTYSCFEYYFVFCERFEALLDSSMGLEHFFIFIDLQYHYRLVHVAPKRLQIQLQIAHETHKNTQTRTTWDMKTLFHSIQLAVLWNFGWKNKSVPYACKSYLACTELEIFQPEQTRNTNYTLGLPVNTQQLTPAPTPAQPMERVQLTTLIFTYFKTFIFELNWVETSLAFDTLISEERFN